MERETESGREGKGKICIYIYREREGMHRVRGKAESVRKGEKWRERGERGREREREGMRRVTRKAESARKG
jgi:hypothetical protein